MKYTLKKYSVVLCFFILFFFLNLGASSEIYYPWKDAYIGAFDAEKWAGLVLIPKQESAFAFHLRVKKGEDTAEGMDLFYLISEVGPHSPDGQYARIKIDLSLPFDQKSETPIMKKPSSGSDTLVLEWSRKDERTVVGRILIPKSIEVHLIHYFPWNYKGRYQFLSDGQVRGSAQADNKQQYLFWSSKRGTLTSPAQGEEMTVAFPEERTIYFVVGLGDDFRILSNHIYRYKNERTIDKILDEEKTRYNKKRVIVNGLHKGIARSITNNLFWMSLYQPGKHRFYTPAGRRWIFPTPDGSLDHWTIFEWDSFFNALELSVESNKHAVDVLKSVLETQYPNGNIPNWRGRFGGTSDRSQPPVGSFVVLKYFLKTANMELLRFAYPILVKWHAFWKEPRSNGFPRRDGNNDGLLEWGSDKELIAPSVPPWEEKVPGKTRAMWESGQDDLPNWDETTFDESSGTLSMNCLDLNSLYALDCWCLAQMAQILENLEDYDTYMEEYEIMKSLINDTLWDEREGFYFDKYWDGRFSRKKAASNFYPLIAGIPDQSKALRMLRRLLNENEFWGDYVLPTISRDDPSFKDQQYWRGTIWPPTNYLVYQGLKAYGFDAVASEFASKSSSLFLRNWNNFQICPENYDSRTGEAGGQRYQSWGPLFSLIALEEFLDVNPWDGFRFGMINPEKKGRLSRISVQGRHYDVEVNKSSIKLWEEGKEIINCNGSAVFRNFLYSKNEVYFEIKTLDSREVKVRFLAKGKYELMLDDRVNRLFEGDSTKIQIPEGEHTVLVLLISEK